jgi:hypothetical protein
MAFFRSFDASAKKTVKVSDDQVGYKILQCDKHKTLAVATIQIPLGATVGKVNDPYMHRIEYTHLTDRCTVMKLEHADEVGRTPCLVGSSISTADIKYKCNVYRYRGMSQSNQSGIRFWPSRDKLFEWKSKDAFVSMPIVPVLVRDEDQYLGEEKSKLEKAKWLATQKSQRRKSALERAKVNSDKKIKKQLLIAEKEEDARAKLKRKQQDIAREKVDARKPKSISQVLREQNEHSGQPRLTTNLKAKKLEHVEFQGLLDEFFNAERGTRKNNL